jgi:hypothetical protein
MEDVMRALVWLGFFAAVFLGWYFYLKARNKERMALIESGKDVSEIYSRQEIRIRIPWLRIGLLVTGIGLGLVVAMLIVSIPQLEKFMREMGEITPIASMILFGGLGIVLGHYLDKPKN